MEKFKKEIFLAELASKYNLDFLDKFYSIPDADIYVFGGAIRDIVLGKDWKEADMRMVLPVSFSDRQILVEQGLEGVTIDEKVILEHLDLIVYRFLPVGSSTDSAVDLSIVPNLETNIPDFTVNSLFYDLKRGKLVDRYNGIDDLKNKILRTCVDPDKEFKERNNEIFRAVKSACKDNLTIEENTFVALKRNAPLAVNVLDIIQGQKTGLLVELFQSDVFRGLKYSPKKYVELSTEIGLIEVFIEFIKKHGSRQIVNLYQNPFNKEEKMSFEQAVSIFISSLSKCFDGENKREVFDEIKGLLSLVEEKKYTDFVIDVDKISYID